MRRQKPSQRTPCRSNHRDYIREGPKPFRPKACNTAYVSSEVYFRWKSFLWFHKYDYIYLGLSRINPCVNAGETSSIVEHSFFSRNYVITFWVTVNSQLACFGSSQSLLYTWYCIELGATCIACKCGQHFVLLAPSGATWIGFKFSHQMASHALVPILATRWRFLH